MVTNATKNQRPHPEPVTDLVIQRMAIFGWLSLTLTPPLTQGLNDASGTKFNLT